MSNRKKDISIDSETDLSLTSDNDSNNTISSKSVILKETTNEMIEQSGIKYCLICSILHSLSNENCCSKHLALLTKALPAQIICNSPKLEYHCRLRNHRFLSSSSLSNTTQSNDFLHSLERERSISSYIKYRRRSATHRQLRLNNCVRTPLSSSIIMNNNNLQKQCRNLSSPILIQRKQQNQLKTSDLIEMNSDLLYTPRISLKRIIHIKDDEDELITNNSQITLNMAQAIKLMIAQENTLPKILLKRIRLEQLT